jgi:hypothetical protein
MIRTLIHVFCTVLFATATACSVGQQQPSATANASVSLCKIMAHPEQHVGEPVTLRVRINVFRHGLSITDDACMKYSVSVTSDQEHADSVADFNRFVAEHRRSNLPLYATLEGRIMNGTADGFLAKRDFVFRLEAAREMHEGSTRTEH